MSAKDMRTLMESVNPMAVLEAPTPAYQFGSTGEAYDACQTSPDIKTGDTLIIKSEGVVGVAGTWPIAVTRNHGQLHTLAAGYDKLDGVSDEQMEAAYNTATKMGLPLREPGEESYEDSEKTDEADEYSTPTTERSEKVVLGFEDANGVHQSIAFYSKDDARHVATAIGSTHNAGPIGMEPIHEQNGDPMADPDDYGVQDDITSDSRHHLPTDVRYAIKIIHGSEQYGEPDEFHVWRQEGGSSSSLGNFGDIKSVEQAEALIAQDAKETGVGRNYEVDYN